MVERLFLTEPRQKLLDGELDWNESSVETEKSRIRTRASLALDGLIEVAKSDQIENSTVFEPEDIDRLLRAILGPDENITPFHSIIDETKEVRDRYNERYEYERAVTSRVHRVGNIYDHRLNSIRAPPSGDVGGLLDDG
jgi:hypothetical protein